MTEKTIQESLFRKFTSGPYLFHLCNTYIFRHDWESDFYFQSKSGIHIEVEIKISRADFKKDLQKVRKHKILDLVTNNGVQLIPFPNRLRHPLEDEEYWSQRPLTGQYNSINWFDIKTNPIPNKFYYAAPAGLIDIPEIPNYSGFIEIQSSGSALIVKKAPIIHKYKYDLAKIIMNKLYWKYVNNRFGANEDEFIEEMQEIDKKNHVEIGDNSILLKNNIQ